MDAFRLQMSASLEPRQIHIREGIPLIVLVISATAVLSDKDNVLPSMI